MSRVGRSPIPLPSGVSVTLEERSVTVKGPQGTLAWLSGLKVPHRIYVHINNTNPMLNDRAPQHREVDDRCVRIGQDGDAVDI